MRVRKIGPVSIQFYFNYNDTWENTKKWRNLDFAELGMEVDVCGKRGVIVGGNCSLNLDVIFNYGTKQQYIDNCHAYYETVYYDKEGHILADYREPKQVKED